VGTISEYLAERLIAKCISISVSEPRNNDSQSHKDHKISPGVPGGYPLALTNQFYIALSIHASLWRVLRRLFSDKHEKHPNKGVGSTITSRDCGELSPLKNPFIVL
jgi:hypothetical protein